MKHWEQALEYATSIQAQQPPDQASPGRLGLERNLNHPAALAHSTAGMAPTDMGLSREPEPDIEPER